MQISTLRASKTNALVQIANLRAAPNPNAILSRYSPTGASAVTAGQDGLSAGVGASQKMAQADLSRLQQYKGAIESAAARHGLPPALLAAIASRESRAGAALDSNGLGDGGNGFGLMQIDFRYHSPQGGPYSAQHVDQAAGILKGMLNEVKARHPSWPPEQQLRGAVAAYNSGVSNVQTLAGMDRGTTGNDYSNDVWARAQALAPKFGGTIDSSGTPWSAAPSLDDVLKNGKQLKQGMQGPAVAEVQKLLGLKADGRFGPATKAAVASFQKANKLTPPPGLEGVVGKTTLEHLKKAGSSTGVDGISAQGREQMRKLL